MTYWEILWTLCVSASLVAYFATRADHWLLTTLLAAAARAGAAFLD